MKKLMALIIALSMPVNSFSADCAVPVKKLEEGSQAPCAGYLFSPEKELEVRVKVKEHNLLKDEINSLNGIVERLQKKNLESDKVIELEIQKSELWRVKAEDSTLKYISSEENRTKRDFWMVILGVALTVGAGYAIGQAAGR